MVTLKEKDFPTTVAALRAESKRTWGVEGREVSAVWIAYLLEQVDTLTYRKFARLARAAGYGNARAYVFERAWTKSSPRFTLTFNKSSIWELYCGDEKLGSGETWSSLHDKLANVHGLGWEKME